MNVHKPSTRLGRTQAAEALDLPAHSHRHRGAPAATSEPADRPLLRQRYGWWFIARGDVCGRGELPGHVGDDDAGGEQQPGLEPKGALVVQELFPPVADDVLRNEDDDDVPWAFAASPPDVVENRPGDLSERRV